MMGVSSRPPGTPVTHHGHVQQAGRVDGHGGEQRPHDVADHRDARAVGAEHVVAVHLVRDDGRLRHVHVHVLEHVRAVRQVQQDGLVTVLGQAVGLWRKRSVNNAYQKLL